MNEFYSLPEEGRGEEKLKRANQNHVQYSCRVFSSSVLHGIIVMHVHDNCQWLAHHNGDPHNNVSDLSSHAPK